MTATEVHTLTSKDFPSLGIATVYRTVKALVETGILVPIVIGGTTRYELAEKSHHHHFYCQECGRVICLEGCPFPETQLAPRGFDVRTHELVVIGACPECAAKNSGVT